MKKNKVSTTEKVYAAAKKLFVTGKELPMLKIAKKVGISMEWARQNVMKLQANGKIVRGNNGRITKVK